MRVIILDNNEQVPISGTCLIIGNVIVQLERPPGFEQEGDIWQGREGDISYFVEGIPWYSKVAQVLQGESQLSLSSETLQRADHQMQLAQLQQKPSCS